MLKFKNGGVIKENNNNNKDKRNTRNTLKVLIPQYHTLIMHIFIYDQPVCSPHNSGIGPTGLLTTVRGSFPFASLSRITSAPTLVKNHTIVSTARRALLGLFITCEPTLVTNHISSVSTVRKSMQVAIIFPSISSCTLERNHTSVTSVRRH